MPCSKSTVRVAGPAGTHFVLTGELYSLDGAKVAIPAMREAGEIGADGSATVVLSAAVAAPRLWSAEKPNLYYVFYRLSDGNQTIVERVQDRIGFRKVELEEGRVHGQRRARQVRRGLPPRGIHALRPRHDRSVLENGLHPHEGLQHQRHSHRPLQPRGAILGVVRRDRLLCPGRDTRLLDLKRGPRRFADVGLHSACQGDRRPGQEPPLRRRLEMRQRKRLRSEQPGPVRLREGPRPHPPGLHLPTEPGQEPQDRLRGLPLSQDR